MANKHYGWLKDKLDVRDYGIHRFLKMVEIPEQFNFVDKMPPVRDQDGIGACVAFSTAYMKDYQDTIEMIDEHGISFSGPVTTSPKWIYYEGRKIEGTIGQDTGMEIRDALQVLELIGVPPEIDCPWNNSIDDVIETTQMVQDANLHKILSYARLDNIDQVKLALATAIPVVVGIPCYENLEDKKVDESGIVPMPKGKMIGGHAITLCGYDKKNVIFENSWGTQWAFRSKVKPGYGLLPNEYLSKFLNDQLADAWTSVDAIIKYQRTIGNLSAI